MLKSMMRDELEEAKFILANGFTEGFSFGEALTVCKYYRCVNGWGDARIKREIVNFILGQDNSFNEIRNRGTLSLLVSYSKKNKMIDKSSPVYIREKELGIIRSIRGYKLQKIALAFLVIAKREKNNGIVNKTKWNDVKLATSSRMINENDIYDCLSLLFEMGLAEVAEKYCRKRGTKGYHKFLFIDEESPVVITIISDREARNVGNLYKQYIGGEIRYCNECGKEFVVKGKTHYYCEKCSKERELEKQRERWKKWSHC